MGNFKKSGIFVLISLILISFTYAYPIIISEEGTNHQQNKDLIYSIPEEYYQYVDNIYFADKPKKIYKFLFFTINYTAGWYEVEYNDNKCLKADIFIYDAEKEVLIHELGHIYNVCRFKNPVNDEEFANNFRILQ